MLLSDDSRCDMSRGGGFLLHNLYEGIQTYPFHGRLPRGFDSRSRRLPPFMQPTPTAAGAALMLLCFAECKAFLCPFFTNS